MKPHRRYSDEEKRALLATVERTQQQSGQPLNWILSELGLSRSVYYDWLERCRKGTLADRVVIPWSPKAALPDEIEAVVDYAKAEPREGYRRLAWMMVNDDIAYLTPSTVYRILDRYDLLYRWKRFPFGSDTLNPMAE